MGRLITKIAGINEAKKIAPALQALLSECGESTTVIPFKIDGSEFVALNNGGDDLKGAFGYIPVGATSAGSIAISVLTAVIHGGSDRNYTSGMTMAKHYGDDWEEKAELI